jgi:hypothetical protein
MAHPERLLETIPITLKDDRTASPSIAQARHRAYMVREARRRRNKFLAIVTVILTAVAMVVTKFFY